MSEDPEDLHFATSEELLKWLQERSDDFDGVSIMVANDLLISGPHGEKLLAENCCAMIIKFNGESIMIHREELEALLNNGILQKMRIPISLIPQVDRE